MIAPPLFFPRIAATPAAPARGCLARRTHRVADAVVTRGTARADVLVYGVDERFWQFHGLQPLAIESRGAALSPALAREIAAEPGTVVLIRMQRPSDIPLESLHSRKEDTGRTLRLTTSAVLGPGSLGDFSLDARQGEVLAAFVPLSRLQQALEVGERVNTIRRPVARPIRRDDTPRKIPALGYGGGYWHHRPVGQRRRAIVGSSAGVATVRRTRCETALPGQPQTAVFTVCQHHASP